MFKPIAGLCLTLFLCCLVAASKTDAATPGAERDTVTHPAAAFVDAEPFGAMTSTPTWTLPVWFALASSMEVFSCAEGRFLNLDDCAAGGLVSNASQLTDLPAEALSAQVDVGAARVLPTVPLAASAGFMIMGIAGLAVLSWRRRRGGTPTAGTETAP